MNLANDVFRQFLDGYRDAALTKDVEAFVVPYADDVYVFDMWNDWSMQGIASWRRMAQTWFGSLGDERVQVEFDDVMSFVADDMVCGRATVTYTALAIDGGKLRSLSNRMTVVLQRRDDAWKVVHEHTSAPIEHTSLKAILRRPA